MSLTYEQIFEIENECLKICRVSVLIFLKDSRAEFKLSPFYIFLFGTRKDGIEIFLPNLIVFAMNISVPIIFFTNV